MTAEASTGKKKRTLRMTLLSFINSSLREHNSSLERPISSVAYCRGIDNVLSLRPTDFKGLGVVASCFFSDAHQTYRLVMDKGVVLIRLSADFNPAPPQGGRIIFLLQ